MKRWSRGVEEKSGSVRIRRRRETRVNRNVKSASFYKTTSTLSVCLFTPLACPPHPHPHPPHPPPPSALLFLSPDVRLFSTTSPLLPTLPPPPPQVVRKFSCVYSFLFSSLNPFFLPPPKFYSFPSQP